MANSIKLVIYLFVLCFITIIINGDPLYFGRTNFASDLNYRKGKGSSRRNEHGRTYNEIARVINPIPYVNIQGGPIPGQPFWTFSKK